MKTLFDLRAKQDGETYEAIGKLYDEPLQIIPLGEQPVTPCTGCWNCWLKTPGKCVIRDVMDTTRSHYVNSDTVILLLDTAQGFINHKAKAFIDRTIPHYHPYIEIVDGECHHVARYERYPTMVFYYDIGGLTPQEDQLIEDYLYRTAYHFKSKAFRILGNGSFKLHSLEPRKARNRTIPFAQVEPMEKLVVYNGSPRRKGSNSELILQKTAAALGDKVEIRDLKATDKWDEWADAFTREQHVLFFMPLYIHAMPSHVMAFMEKLQPSRGSLGFFVQSGFPESSQSHYLEAYFERLTTRLGRTYLGTAIKGGMEGLQARPPQAQEKMITPMVAAINHLFFEGKLNPAQIGQMARPVRFGPGISILIKLVSRLGLINFYWNVQLKKNDAFEKRFDRPYRME
jgi:hypothetical protein